MSAVVKVLLVGFLLQRTHCEDFGVYLPEQMEALRGSCLRIPCSFTVRDDHKNNLNKAPATPTVTPPTVSVSEGNQPTNTRVTVSPSGPVTEHSNVSLTCSSDANPAVQHYHWYKADGGTHTLIGNSAVLNMKASRETTVIFCEAQNARGAENSTIIKLDVQFPAQILNSSSNCSGDLAQISCVCETEGNPFPLIHWSFQESLQTSPSAVSL
ncbi:hypothetical protein WMY93_026629 [Mugilogobius chulae]|uniref:Ig-like domain-containing protein n=1 Tax=Mugilogobius chulae TaxID=88201 RepID=A0AAW0N849_9GOBI